MPPTRDQFAGCVLGLALGDALGAVVEALPAAQARRYVDETLRAGKAGSVGREPFQFGQVTDDTQLMHELLQSIVEAGSFEPARFAARLSAIVGRGDLIGGGPASRAAATALAAGVPWTESGAPAPYAGNGAAMRAGPLGLMYGHDPRLLVRVVKDQARITHQDPRAAAGALAIAAAVALAAERQPIIAGEFLGELAGAVEQVDPPVARCITDLIGWVGLSEAAAAQYLWDHPIGPEQEGAEFGISSFVTSSVCWSLYAFLRAPESWWDSACIAIRVGGDTDTLGAMTGSIAGARLGTGALPEELTARLTDRGRWTRADLEALSERCHRLTQASSR